MRKLILICCMMPLWALAQVESTQEYYFDGSATPEFDDGIVPVNNIIKINLLNIFIGDLPIYYERKFDKRLSVEVGAGYTFRNYFFGVWQASLREDSEFMNKRQALPGFSARASVRYFPNQNRQGLYDIEGFYFGPEIQYKLYRMEVYDCDPNFPGEFTENTLDEYRKLLDFKVTFGYTQFYSGNFVVDFYGGIGVRHKNVKLHECGWDVDTRYFLSIPEFDDKVVPVISAGFKFGIGFNTNSSGL